ncbi:MAG: GerW family sporulation protein [Dysosmobacter welbionis]
MDETMDKKRPLSDLMRSTMDKIREMADTNTIVGQPITTPDGVTLIPISRVSMGFGCGGADYGKTQPKDFGGGSGAGVKIEPVAFLVIREERPGLPVAMPPMTTLDPVVEMMPDLVDKVEKYFDKKEEKEPV